MTINIALFGRSGSGKTTVAGYLVAKHQYTLCSTGLAVRTIGKMLFHTESRTYLNRITDAMRAIDETVWLRLALASASGEKPIVFDSMRFLTDYNYLQNKGFSLWHVDSPIESRIERMQQRGQEHDLALDELHVTEVELEGLSFDYKIWNDSDTVSLYQKVDNFFTNRNL